MLKRISIYSIGNIFSAAISFLLLPLYTRILTPADYGSLELVYLFSSFLVVFFGLNVELAYTRYYYLFSSESERGELFMTVQIFKVLCVFFFIWIIAMNYELIVSSYFVFSEGGMLLNLIVFTAAIEVLMYAPLNLLRLEERPWPFVLVTMVNVITTILLTIFFLVFLKYGVKGVLYGKLVGTAVSFLLLVFFTLKEWKLQFSLPKLKILIGFSIFLIPINFSSMLINLSNRYFLLEFQTLSDVGVFSLGSKIATIIPILLSEPIKNAFIPYLFSMSEDLDICRKTLSSFTQFYFLLVSTVVLALSVFSYEIIEIFASSAYTRGGEVVFILSISNMFLGTSALIVLSIHLIKKTWLVTIIWLLSAVINVLMNLWLIPIFGNYGAAFASLISVVSILFFYLMATQLYFPLGIKYTPYVKTLVLLFASFVIGSQIKFAFYFDILVKLILVCTYVYIVYSKLGVLDDKYKNRISSLAKSIRIKI